MQEVHNLRQVRNHGVMSGSNIKYVYDTALGDSSELGL